MEDRSLSGRQQLDVMVVERQRMFGVCRAFAEIQAGQNPMTQNEIARLAERRPQYVVLRQYADRAVEWVNESHPELEGEAYAEACGEAAEEIALLDGEGA